MYEFLRGTHSVLRYVILLGGIGAVATILMNAKSRIRLFSTIFMVSCHLQFVIGFVLYFFVTDWFNLLKENAGERSTRPRLVIIGMETVEVLLLVVSGLLILAGITGS
eukprot:gene6725-9090_t